MTFPPPATPFFLIHEACRPHKKCFHKGPIPVKFTAEMQHDMKAFFTGDQEEGTTKETNLQSEKHCQSCTLACILFYIHFLFCARHIYLLFQFQQSAHAQFRCFLLQWQHYNFKTPQIQYDEDHEAGCYQCYCSTVRILDS